MANTENINNVVNARFMVLLPKTHHTLSNGTRKAIGGKGHPIAGRRSQRSTGITTVVPGCGSPSQFRNECMQDTVEVLVHSDLYTRWARLRSLDHGTHALGVERLTALVEVAGVLQPVADLSEAKTLSPLGACPP
jgi:hypothetical protein